VFIAAPGTETSTWSGRFKSFRWDYVLGKALHLFKLGAALQQEKVNANRFKLGNAFRNLAGCADQSGPQSSITDGVIFEGNMLIKLCAGQPLLDNCRNRQRTASRR
jgi:hypothetical protein